MVGEIRGKKIKSRRLERRQFFASGVRNTFPHDLRIPVDDEQCSMPRR